MGGASILVVDDDADIRDTLVQILEEEGFTAAGVANGHEAMEYLQQTDPAPALILLDLMMPVMDGWRFRSHQQAEPALARIPVVVISGDASVPQKAKNVAADGYLKKPIELDALIAIARRYAGGGKRATPVP